MAKAPRALRYQAPASMPTGMRALYDKQHGYRPPAAPTAARGSKYGAKPTVVDGIRFDSQAEARYFQNLKLRVAAGQVEFFLRQVPMHLPGNTRYVLDFLEFLPCTCGGCSCKRARFVDVKGVETQTFRLKKRQTEALYPITVEIEK
ncbi:DUF1064 domain-containing protein [Luteimonas sp. MJ174]|uniref:DUF1064 domain-containing protein n=1 Tax=Luteimonas sp. MJ174 TaxID=3129237 RepID=UPI0031BB7E61